jgi:hypothetical protein
MWHHMATRPRHTRPALGYAAAHPQQLCLPLTWPYGVLTAMLPFIICSLALSQRQWIVLQPLLRLLPEQMHERVMSHHFKLPQGSVVPSADASRGAQAVPHSEVLTEGPRGSSVALHA